MNARSIAICAMGVLLLAMAAFGQALVTAPTNKHNLSTSGPGPVKSVAMTEICVFCHTPHNSSPDAPLWNQTLSSGVTYQPYTSSTMAASVGMPTGSSKRCLSCHDGTVAIGNRVKGGQIAMQGVNAQGRLTGSSVISPDLRSSHPISFVPVLGLEIVAPPGNSPVKLDGSGQLQCVSCHDPHRMDADPTTKKFLVANNSSSGLCMVCHNKLYWSTNPSTHKTSTKSFASAQGAHTGYTTVATNGCESCHKPHAATTTPRGLKAIEEATCGTCHGTSGIGRDVQAEFNKLYVHPTYSVTPSVHDAAESPNGTPPLPETSAGTPRHAECTDCHNAHASYAAAASAPKGSGKIAGMWGVDRNNTLKLPVGAPASVNEYEICYKCHGGSSNKPQASGGPAPPYPNRVAPQFDMRLMFDPAGPSFHPVEAAGRNTSVPSLLAPWTTSSVMYCTDCHDSNTGPKAAPTPGTGPSGPHGSAYKHLLLGRYEMDSESVTESAAVYALCYKCHSRTSILNDQSFDRHHTHISDERTPCSICHDPHGISPTQGNSTNHSNLINFDKRFVTPSSTGILRFDDLGTQRGRCYLTCHGENHNPETYP